MDTELEMDMDVTVTMTKRQLMDLLAYDAVYVGMMMTNGGRPPKRERVVAKMRERRRLEEGYPEISRGMLKEIDCFVRNGFTIPDEGLGEKR